MIERPPSPRWLLLGALVVFGCSSSSAEVITPGAGGGTTFTGIIQGPCTGAACVCVAGQGTCSNGKATLCRDDGMAVVSFDCDATQGMVCEANGCKGKCSPAELHQSYIGCDYYPTVTLNPIWSGFDFAVAVANTAQQAVTVNVTRAAASVDTRTVAAGGVEIIKLPWVAELKGGDVDACQNPPDPGSSRIVTGGAYRLRTDGPVTVYQFSPLTYEIVPAPADCPVGTKCPGGLVAECNSYSADASLLLPVNVLTGNYTALAWPSNGNRAGFFAVTATADGTDVDLIGSGRIAAGAGIDQTGSGKARLNAGDVLQVVAQYGGATDAFGDDVSGTRIRASKPVQVIGGHSCARIPAATTGYCDHLEEAMFPAETLGSDYLVTFPASPAGDSPHLIRVAAINAGTTVRFDPAIAPDATIGPDSAPLQIAAVTTDVRIQADKPIIVGQYMQGSTSVPSGLGDPSESLAIPTAQFRTSYRFVASSTYYSNYVNVIVGTGTTVTLDGNPIGSSEFTTIGTSGYSVARHELSRTADVHSIEASTAFGVVVYGYGKDTSYMYPGGLDLAYIASPPIR